MGEKGGVVKKMGEIAKGRFPKLSEVSKARAHEAEKWARELEKTDP